MTINITPALPLGLRIRLFVERLLAATGPDAERDISRLSGTSKRIAWSQL